MNSISDVFQVYVLVCVTSRQASTSLGLYGAFSELVMWLCRLVARLLHLRAGLYFTSSNFAVPTFRFHATHRSSQLVYLRIVTMECNQKHLHNERRLSTLQNVTRIIGEGLLKSWKQTVNNFLRYGLQCKNFLDFVDSEVWRFISVFMTFCHWTRFPHSHVVPLRAIVILEPIAA